MMRVEIGDAESGSWRTEEQRFRISECEKRDEAKRRLRVSLLH
jgi:hypothetical protein